MRNPVRLRRWVMVGAAVTLVLAVLFPPWSVLRVTPQGTVPLRVEFSFLFGGGPHRAAPGMYPERSVVKADWLAFEVLLIIMAAGVLVLLSGQGRTSARGGPPRVVREAARDDVASGADRGYQSSFGESFEQHAARLERVWRGTAASEAPQPAPGDRGLDRAVPPSTERDVTSEGGIGESGGAYQSSPGEPLDQHAARLRRIWRARGAGGKAKNSEDEG